MCKTVALRRAWLEKWGHGIFRDGEDLLGVEESALIKKYDIENGILIACAEEKGLTGNLCVRWTRSDRAKLTLLTAEDLTPQAKEITVQNGVICLEMPATELALFAIEAI